jgi:predicted phosphoadenosine phosphosulfate sulfurtransferase
MVWIVCDYFVNDVNPAVRDIELEVNAIWNTIGTLEVSEKEVNVCEPSDDETCDD